MPSTSPTVTTSPACLRIFCSTPLCSALTSTLTLSVSNSTSASPCFTSSPSLLSHVAITASTIDSPNDGTRISTAIRSEEHTSELQSRQYLVCRLLLEKKNTKK